MKKIRRTVNTTEAKDEPVTKNKVMFVRVPPAIAERLRHQRDRLSCSMGTMVRMSIVKFLEEQESSERESIPRREEGAENEMSIL